MPQLKAMPGRVILKFEAPKEQIGLIHVPKTSARREEFGTLVDIGEVIDERERPQATEIRERAAAGHLFPVSYASGISYWQDEFKDRPELAWLKDFRVYKISELAVSLPPGE